MHNTSLCMETQEALMQEFQSQTQTNSLPLRTEESDLHSQQFSDNTKFLYDMLQQVKRFDFVFLVY